MSRPAHAFENPAAGVACDHCNLPVPRGLIEPGATRQFCCNGCRAVYDAIHDAGLERYYELQRELGDAAQPAATTGRSYAAYDEPAFRSIYTHDAGAGGYRAEMYLEGLHCAACVWLIERLPSILPGLLEARVDFGRRRIRLTWDDRRIALSSIARRLDALGYPSHPYREDERCALRRREERRQLARLGIAGAIAGNSMLISFALYGRMFNGMEREYFTLFRWSGLLLTLLMLAGPGREFFRKAYSSLRGGVMHMDLPVAIALTAGTLWGAANTIRGVGQTYFESMSGVVFLLLVGRWLQFRRQRAAQDAVEALYRLTPVTARLVEDSGEIRELPVESLQAGARVEVRAGDSVPADGTIVAGRSELDLSLLTGESRPVTRGTGDKIHAGTLNLASRIVVEVESTGERTRVGRLMGLVEQFARDRPPIVQLADRVAQRFVVVVLVWAALTLAFWLWRAPQQALEHAISVLIVTCPCALGLATPLAIVAAIGRAARRGILIKGGEVLERLAKPGLILLDKTGTLTQGRMALVSWDGEEAVKPLVAALEASVAHPIARALREAFRGDATFEVIEGAEVEQVLGGGVAGSVRNRHVVVGSPNFVRRETPEMPEWAAAAERRCTERALTPVLVAVDGSVVAVAGLGDPLLQDARASLDALRRMGWQVGMLSGDHPQVVAAVAREVGIEPEACEGGATPERKIEAIRRAQQRHKVVVMVGDGVNDAAAMPASSVGIAVHGGAEASLAASDVYLRRPGLQPLVELLAGCPRAVAVIRRNLGISLVYNLAAAVLATLGLIDPLIAAVLMPVSSLTVLTLSYRSRTFGA